MYLLWLVMLPAATQHRHRPQHHHRNDGAQVYSRYSGHEMQVADDDDSANAGLKLDNDLDDDFIDGNDGVKYDARREEIVNEPYDGKYDGLFKDVDIYEPDVSIQPHGYHQVETLVHESGEQHPCVVTHHNRTVSCPGDERGTMIGIVVVVVAVVAMLCYCCDDCGGRSSSQDTETPAPAADVPIRPAKTVERFPITQRAPV